MVLDNAYDNVWCYISFIRLRAREGFPRQVPSINHLYSRGCHMHIFSIDACFADLMKPTPQVTADRGYNQPWRYHYQWEYFVQLIHSNGVYDSPGSLWSLIHITSTSHHLPHEGRQDSSVKPMSLALHEWVKYDWQKRSIYIKTYTSLTEIT
jgi:hypothetical protein